MLIPVDTISKTSQVDPMLIPISKASLFRTMNGPTFPLEKNKSTWFFKAEIGRLRLPSFALKAVNIRNSVKNSVFFCEKQLFEEKSTGWCKPCRFMNLWLGIQYS